MAEARKLLAEFAELLIPARTTFTSSWAAFLGRMQKAEPQELEELRGFLNANLPVCFYTTRTGGVEFLGGDLLARRMRCFAWSFKHLGTAALSRQAREWCEDVVRSEVPGTLDARGMEDILSAKFAVRTLLNHRELYRGAPVSAPDSVRPGQMAHAGTSFANRLSFGVLSA